MRAHRYWGAPAALLAVVGTALALGPLGAGSAASRPHPGDLDPSFGTGGTVAESLGAGPPARRPYVQAVAVQRDGKIVVAVALDGVPRQLSRYLPDGSPDPSFGEGGDVDTSSLPMRIRALALQPDGRIVVAGCNDAEPAGNVVFVVARYHSDGLLDTGFGEEGIRHTRIHHSPSPRPWGGCANAVALTPDAKILVAGSAYFSRGDYDAESSFDFVRYRPNGSLDSTFGDRGIVQTPMFSVDVLEGIAVAPDGRIAASGTHIWEGGDFAIDLALYEPDGSLDAREMTNYEYLGGPPALQNGKILVAGTWVGPQSLGSPYAVVARFGWDGRLDAGFGEGGLAATRGAGATTILTLANGKIVIAGNAGGGRVGRLLPDGRFDKSFGTAGVASFGAHQGIYALALQPDGKILAGGGWEGRNSWTLTRLLGDHDCVVPALRGRTVARATARLRSAHCSPGRIVKRFSRVVRRGRVVASRPVRATRLHTGAKVRLVVSRGRPAHRSR